MRRPHYSWVILATGFFILFFSGGSRFAFGLMLKPMSEDLDVSRSTLSLAVTTFMVVSALALPFLGRLVDLWSLKGMIGIAAVVAGVGIGLMGQVDAPWQVFIVYGVVYALGNAGTSTSPVTVMISRWFPNRRGIAGSGAVAGNAVGQLVIVMALAAVLVSLDWRWSFTILGIANLAVLAPLVFLAVRDKPREADVPPHGLTARAVTPPESALSLSRTLTSPRLALLMAIYAICGFQDFFVSIHIVAFALDQGVGTVMAGNLLALMGLMGLMGVLASGLLADRFGAVRPTVTCFWVRIFIFALIIFDQSTLSIMVFGLLYGFTFLIHRAADRGLRGEHLRRGAAGDAGRINIDGAPDRGRLRSVRRGVDLRQPWQLRRHVPADVSTIGGCCCIDASGAGKAVGGSGYFFTAWVMAMLPGNSPSAGLFMRSFPYLVVHLRFSAVKHVLDSGSVSDEHQSSSEIGWNRCLREKEIGDDGHRRHGHHLANNH